MKDKNCDFCKVAIKFSELVKKKHEEIVDQRLEERRDNRIIPFEDDKNL